jgi:hypothetical protein
MKYTINMNQIQQIKGYKTFDEYVRNLQIEYIKLIKPEKVNNNLKEFKMFNNDQTAPLTSRGVNLGGTSVLTK